MATVVENHQIVWPIVLMGEIRDFPLQPRLRLLRRYFEGLGGIVKSLLKYLLEAFDLDPSIV